MMSLIRHNRFIRAKEICSHRKPTQSPFKELFLEMENLIHGLLQSIFLQQKNLRLSHQDNLHIYILFLPIWTDFSSKRIEFMFGFRNILTQGHQRAEAVDVCCFCLQASGQSEGSEYSLICEKYQRKSQERVDNKPNYFSVQTTG